MIFYLCVYNSEKSALDKLSVDMQQRLSTVQSIKKNHDIRNPKEIL